MAKKVKEKTTKSTNIDLDNEIIIGIKTLPEIEPKKKNKKKKILYFCIYFWWKLLYV